MAGTVTDSGCWIDGWWGQYGVARSVQIAHEFGFGDLRADEAELVEIAERHLATIGGSGAPTITDDEWETLTGAADDIVDWLNDRAAAHGYSFGWHEGELMLWADAEWEETYE